MVLVGWYELPAPLTVERLFSELSIDALNFVDEMHPATGGSMGGGGPGGGYEGIGGLDGGPGGGRL